MTVTRSILVNSASARYNRADGPYPAQAFRRPPRMLRMSGFVVKAVAPNGDLSWISPPAMGELPILVSRARAEIFPTRVAAHAAIEAMPYVLEQGGVKFTAEAAW